MTLALLFLTAGFAAAAAIEAHRARIAAELPAHTLIGKSVLVSTIGSTAVRGVVYADLADGLTLRESVVLTVGTDAAAPAQGLLHIGRERIDYVQELPSPAAIAED